jgi:bifunctional non-homologous end joining protein LigD
MPFGCISDKQEADLNIQDYSNQNEKVKPNADIQERWQKRVVARGLNGASGARQYLADYGKGIGLKKVIMLARQAQMSGDIPMSEIFWAKAHELEYGESPTGSLTGSGQPIPVVTAPVESALPGITLQPGEIVPSQPIDARHSREYYIENPAFWGMQKHDGQKKLVFASASGCVWQARSTNVQASPSQELNDAMVRVANELGGSFVLEGEFTYLDCEGREHRTAAQAATANAICWKPEEPPIPMYYVFDCLEFMGDDIRNMPKSARLERAFQLVFEINGICDIIHTTHLAQSEKSKSDMVRCMQAEGREGEIWFKYNEPYRPGKSADGHFVRTKYLEEFEANIVAVFPATAEGHTISGFKIADDNGRSMGTIGTGYSREDQQDILKRFQAGNTRVRIRCQGFTEGGRVWHGRFIGWPQ